MCNTIMLNNIAHLSGHTHSYDDSLSMTHSTNFTISTGCSGSFDLLVGISFRFL